MRLTGEHRLEENSEEAAARRSRRFSSAGSLHEQTARAAESGRREDAMYERPELTGRAGRALHKIISAWKGLRYPTSRSALPVRGGFGVLAGDRNNEESPAGDVSSYGPGKSKPAVGRDIEWAICCSGGGIRSAS